MYRTEQPSATALRLMADSHAGRDEEMEALAARIAADPSYADRVPTHVKIMFGQYQAAKSNHAAAVAAGVVDGDAA